jgi:SAM-dependent methyltransferase
VYKIVRTLSEGSSFARRTTSRLFYQYISTLDKDGIVTLMNYGYVDLDPEARQINLEAKDEFNRYPLQLYHKVASAIDLRGLDVLEVGSGRGGGAAYISHHLGPRSMTGVDYSDKAVAFCQGHLAGNGLRYLHGDAEDLPFSDTTFDAVVNVESSHCYGDMGRFLEEVHRVLRPGGYLLWTDLRPPDRIRALHTDIEQSGFEVVKEENISANVLAAMSVQRERNKTLVDNGVAWYARRAFYHFAGVEGTSYIHRLLQSGRLEYLNMVLRRNGLEGNGVRAGR